MPNCFQLTPKGSTEPEKLAVIDDKMREHFDAPADPECYFRYWYDIIGLRLAMGSTFEQMKTEWQNESGYDDLIEIVDYLNERYTANAWSQRW